MRSAPLEAPAPFVFAPAGGKIPHEQKLAGKIAMRLSIVGLESKSSTIARHCCSNIPSMMINVAKIVMSLCEVRIEREGTTEALGGFVKPA